MDSNHDVHVILGQLFKSRPPSTIIEIGAHYGTDTYELRQQFSAARIIAFEPDPRNIYLVKRANIHKIVEFVEAAVSDQDGEAVFYLSDGHPPGAPKSAAITGWSQSSSLKKPDQATRNYPWLKFERKSCVKTVRLDTYCEQAKVGQVDFLWADVQGAEAEVIAGAQKTLARTHYFFTEFGVGNTYEGEIGADEILARLPGSWEVLEKWHTDILLRNKSLAPDA